MNTLTLNRLHQALSYDLITGIFIRLERAGPQKPGDEAGGASSKGYHRICVYGKRYRTNRLAWFYVYGVWPKDQIDHVDGHRSNNAIANLRPATNTLNSENERNARRNNKAGLLGVVRDGERWRAYIKVAGKTVALGRFASDLAAHHAYVKAKRELHAGCTI